MKGKKPMHSRPLATLRRGRHEAKDDFEAQNAIPYFPQWIEEHRGLAPNPLVTVQPDSSGVVHRWPVWNQPIFVPHPDDGGLR
jgi:hypothetical protein